MITTPKDTEFAQREAYIRAQLAEDGKLEDIEVFAQEHGFRDPAAAIKYVISEMARDDEQYRRMTNSRDIYTSDEFAQVVYLHLENLKRTISNPPSSRFSPPDRGGRGK